MLQGSKTIKIMKKSKNRRGLTKVNAIFFAYKQTRNIDILTAMKLTLKNIFSLCVVRSEHHIDILNTELIGKKHLSKLTHLSKKLFLIGFLLGFNKEVQKEPLKAGV